MTAMAHLKLLLVLLWVGVTVSAHVDLQKRIIGGQICDKGERQYHVKLTLNDQFKCGGSLINEKWVLTAAHCWKTTGTMKAVLGLHPDKKPIIVEFEGEPQTFSTDPDHDIMLLKLKTAVKTIQTVKLPTDCKDSPPIGEKIQMAGYGATAAGPNNIKISREAADLHCADIAVVDCQTVFGTTQPSHPNWICYQSPGIDTCPGDSGGGVVYKDLLHGVHYDGGIIACSEPGTATEVCKYIDWISKVIAT